MVFRSREPQTPKQSDPAVIPTAECIVTPRHSRPKTQRHPVTSLGSGGVPRNNHPEPVGLRDLSVLDGPEDVNLNVLFAGGGVLLEFSVVHWCSPS